MRKTLDLTTVVLGMLMVLVFWEALSWLIDSPIMPSPFEVIPIFLTLLTGELGLHFMASTGRVLASITLAVITAVPAGLALGQMPKLNRIFDPLIAIV